MTLRAFLIAVMLMAGITPAMAKPLPCWLVKSAIVMTGSEKEALARGYSKAEVAAARRKCLGK